MKNSKEEVLSEEKSILLYQYYKPFYKKNKSILKSKIYLNNVRNFNDPYELSFKIPTDPAYFEKIGFEQSEENKKFHDNMIRLSQSENIYNDLISKLTESYTISCFSREILNPLMWSHYADKHKGMCLVYEFELQLCEGNLLGLKDLMSEESKLFFEDVTYQDEVPILYPIADVDSTFKNRKILTTKSKAWEYEKEVRILSKLKTGNVEIHPESLRAIFFGMRFDNSLIQRYMLTFRKKFPWLEFFQISKNIGSYKLEIKNITS